MNYQLIRRVVLCKNIFALRYSHMIINIEFKIFDIILNIEVIYTYIHLYIYIYIYIYSMICYIFILQYVVVFINYFIPVIDTQVYINILLSYPCKFFLSNPDKPPNNNRFSFNCVFYCTANMVSLIGKLTTLIYPHLAWFTARLI